MEARDHLVPDEGFTEVLNAFIASHPEWMRAARIPYIAPSLANALLLQSAGSDDHVSPTDCQGMSLHYRGFKVEDLRLVKAILNTTEEQSP